MESCLSDTSVILFYRYFSLSSDELAHFHHKLHSLCQQQHLLGRILLAHEGINGTLAGSTAEIHEFVSLVMNLDARFQQIDWKYSKSRGNVVPFNDLHIKHVKELINCGDATRDYIDQFVSFDDSTFGGLSGTGKHLTPQEFHDGLVAQDGLVIDVRNEFEYSIGHFKGACNLKTNTYAETWKALDKVIQDCEETPQKVYMYCTGGIRCEKASVYLKAKGIPNVYHLQGGIHKYLEAFATVPESERMFVGKEFVFDARVAMSAVASTASSSSSSSSSTIPTAAIDVEGSNDDEASHAHNGSTGIVSNQSSEIIASEAHPSFRFVYQEKAGASSDISSAIHGDSIIVGRCVDCNCPHDLYSGLVVCTVCSMPVLCCPSCVESNRHPGEYYCTKHRNLKDIYFTVLDGFSIEELRQQERILSEMERALLGRKEKNRRRTLRNQRERISDRIKVLIKKAGSSSFSPALADHCCVDPSSLALEDKRQRLVRNPKAQNLGQFGFWQS